jgi:hypothetical protein
VVLTTTFIGGYKPWYLAPRKNDTYNVIQWVKTAKAQKQGYAWWYCAVKIENSEIDFADARTNLNNSWRYGIIVIGRRII